MSRLLTSRAFASSLIDNKDKAVDDPFFYNEGAMLRLDTQQQTREQYVKARLAGWPAGATGYEEDENASGLSMHKTHGVEGLKKKIAEVRREKNKVLSEGVTLVQSYMEQLKREHEEHAHEMQRLRDTDSENTAKFISEIEAIKLKYRRTKKPVEEIIAKVKSTIAEEHAADGRSISAIHVTEVDPERRFGDSD